MHRTVSTAALTLTLFLLLTTVMACSGSPSPDPTATGIPTQEPAETQATTATARPLIPTLSPRQIAATQDAGAAEIRARQTPVVFRPLTPAPVTIRIPNPTPKPIHITLPTPTPIRIVLPTPTPFRITIPTFAPLPTIRIPTFAPLPTLDIPTFGPSPTIPAPETHWTVDYEDGDLAALVLTPSGVDPVRAIVVDCATDQDGERWLALKIIGGEVFPFPEPYTGVQMTQVIDGGAPIVTEWFPPSIQWDEGNEDFHILSPSRELGTAIIDAFMGGARSLEMSSGNIRYRFDTYGFPQAAKDVIDHCDGSGPQASALKPATTPVPTLKPITLPTLTFVAPTTPPLPTVTFEWVSSEVEEFAQACVETMDAGTGLVTEEDFDLWVEDLVKVKAPPALEQFWDARVRFFAVQVETGDAGVAMQEAYDDELWAIHAMEANIWDALIETGCITEIDVVVAGETAAAWERLLAGYGQDETVTVEEFAEACSDVGTVSPLYEGAEAVPVHLLYWWDLLVPPPGLEMYYQAVRDYYHEWVSVGLESISVDTEMAVLEAAQSLEGDHLEILLRTRCAG